MIAVAEPIDADTLRLRHEFLALPDLCVSAEACAQLLGVPLRRAVGVLESLASEGFLDRTDRGRYERPRRARP